MTLIERILGKASEPEWASRIASCTVDTDCRNGSGTDTGDCFNGRCVPIAFGWGGGLALAAFEMAEAAGVGLILEPSDNATLFGEDQGRYLIACSFDKAEALMTAAARAQVSLMTIGKFSGSKVRFSTSEAPLHELSDIYNSAFQLAIG